MKDRFVLQKSKAKDNVWLCTDTENNIVIEFQQGKFNETQKVNYLFDIENPEPLKLAKQMREVGEWLSENHSDKLF